VVEFVSPWEVANGMCEARRRGYGAVTSYLKAVGVPRPTAYRWEQRQRRLLEFGWEGVKRLAAEHEALAKLEKARRALGKYQTNGPTRSYHRAQATMAASLEAMRQTPQGRSLAEKLKGLDNPAFFTRLSVLEERLAPLGLEQVGPARQARLGREVARTLAWRRKDKTAASVLRRASTGSVADEVELAILEAADHAVRSSSSVECVNSRVRLAQVARKRLSENYVYLMVHLMAVYDNVHAFGRGRVREGHSPAELAGIELPTTDWIELLDLADIEDAAATPSARRPSRSEQAATSAEAAA